MFEQLKQAKALFDVVSGGARNMHISDQLLMVHQVATALQKQAAILDEEHKRQFPHRECDACQKGLHQACTRCGVGALGAAESKARCACHGGRVAYLPTETVLRS